MAIREAAPPPARSAHGCLMLPPQRRGKDGDTSGEDSDFSFSYTYSAILVQFKELH